ncbi:hypothetical protein L0F63_004037, partial [Massospora cicadina]
ATQLTLIINTIEEVEQLVISTFKNPKLDIKDTVKATTSAEALKQFEEFATDVLVRTKGF